MGQNQWVDEETWPIPGTKNIRYFLHSKGKANSLYGDGILSDAEAGEEKEDAYTYDPADPGTDDYGRNLCSTWSPDDYRSIERRDDVLVFSAAPFLQDKTVCGAVRMQLSASSSAKDTDFTAKLLDVWPNGFAQRLSDGIVRARYRDGGDKPSLITPGQIYSYDIDLWNTCQVFKAGHSPSGGSFIEYLPEVRPESKYG